MISTHWHGRGDVISDCPRVVSDQRDQISELNVAKRQPNQFLLSDIFQNSPNSCCHTFGHHLKETLSPRTFKKLPNHWSHCWWRQQQTANARARATFESCLTPFSGLSSCRKLSHFGEGIGIRRLKNFEFFVSKMFFYIMGIQTLMDLAQGVD